MASFLILYQVIYTFNEIVLLIGEKMCGLENDVNLYGNVSSSLYCSDILS